jgi:hypothetical protein
MKAPTIVPVSDGSPFRRELGAAHDHIRQLGEDAKLCNEIPRATCGKHGLTLTLTPTLTLPLTLSPTTDRDRDRRPHP